LRERIIAWRAGVKAFFIKAVVSGYNSIKKHHYLSTSNFMHI